MRVLLATDNKELDDYLKKHTDIDVSGEVYYREALVDSLRQNKCDTVILSVFLNGEEDMLDIVFQLRMADARVIMLMGDTGKTDTKVFELVAMGVYDILFSPISVSEIVKTVNEPKNLSHILNELNAPWRPESKTLISKFKAFMRRKPKDEEAKSEVVAVEEVQVETKIVKKADKKPTGSKAVPSYSFFNLTNSLAKDNKEKRHKKSKIDIIEEPAKAADSDYKARAVAVMGTAEKVGSTSFAIALAKSLEQTGNKVRIVDAGGGAEKWLERNGLKCCTDLGITPGTITIFDMGHKMPEGVLPFAEHVFIVTDNSPCANPTIIMPYIVDKTYLVGTKGMDEDILYALADLKMVKPLFLLPETSELILAEQKRVGIIPKKWRKSMQRAAQIVLLQ